MVINYNVQVNINYALFQKSNIENTEIEAIFSHKKCS